VSFEFVSKSFSSLTQGHTIFAFAIAAGGGDGASRLEAERHLLQTGRHTQNPCSGQSELYRDVSTVAASWRPILPNRQLAKVYSFEQTSPDDPAKISEKSDGCLASQKCMTIKG
jgi:hypothetical protein